MRSPCNSELTNTRDERSLGSSLPSQSQKSLSARTQIGPPRVEAVLGYLHQPLLSITHQLCDKCSNDKSGSEQD